MKKSLIVAFCLAIAVGGVCRAVEPREAEELCCLPVNGYIRLPGIAFDDMTPLARNVFKSNPAAVTNALYALPSEQREDFIALYLEPKARERHRYFFARCAEIAERRALEARVEGGDVLPARLVDELRERERVRLALHDGAIPFRLDGRLVYVPVPTGYAFADGAAAAHIRENGLAEGLAEFRKLDKGGVTDPRYILATLKHVRDGADSLSTMLAAYRIMVDDGWRLVGMYPEGAATCDAETVEYRWNLAPFQVRENSFCYGQFEKNTDFHGVERIRYRVTAVVMLSGAFIQVSVVHGLDTALDMVNEMNADLVRWRDAILAANMQ